MITIAAVFGESSQSGSVSMRSGRQATTLGLTAFDIVVRVGDWCVSSSGRVGQDHVSFGMVLVPVTKISKSFI